MYVHSVEPRDARDLPTISLSLVSEQGKLCLAIILSETLKVEVISCDRRWERAVDLQQNAAFGVGAVTSLIVWMRWLKRNKEGGEAEEL